MTIRDSQGDVDKDSAYEENRLRLLKKARIIDALTFVAVILASPASVVLSYSLGVMPEVWLAVWLRYVLIFIFIAIGLALLGFSVSDHYWLEANKQRKGTR